MSIFDNEFMIVPVAEGGFVIRSQSFMHWREGLTPSAKEMRAFTDLYDLMEYLNEQSEKYEVLPDQDEVNKLK